MLLQCKHKAIMFLPGLKCKFLMVNLYILLIITYDLAVPVLSWRQQAWKPNAIVSTDGKLHSLGIYDYEHLTVQIDLF